MDTHEHSSSSQKQVAVALFILLLGIAIGSLLDLKVPESGPLSDVNATLLPVLVLSEPGAPVASNGLHSLSLHFSPEVAAGLQEEHNRAAEQLITTDDQKSWHPATVTLGTKTLEAEIRLKGDLADHVETDRWSLRVRLIDGKLMGMRIFSIQHPRTRGYLWEWLSHEAARQDGLLSPRTSYVNVTINNNPNGLYYLEEHFSKEMLESQQRREGPILRLADTTYWTVQLQHHLRTLSNPGVSASAIIAYEPDRTATVAYDEKRLGRVDTLNRQLDNSVRHMRTLQNELLLSRKPAERLTRLNALRELKMASLETTMDLDQVAQYHGLVSLFQAGHALLWFNLRYYHNPITSKLEPIVFDLNAHEKRYLTDIVPLDPKAKAFADIPAYQQSFYHHILTYSQPSYLERLRDRTEATARLYESALRAEGTLPDDHSYDALFNRLRERQIWLHPILSPAVAAGFSGVITRSEGADDRLSIDAWTTTATPVLIEHFQFSNGKSIEAREVLVSPSAAWRTRNGGIVLPPSGQHIQFTFPSDARLSGLRNVKEIKKSIRAATTPSDVSPIALNVEYRTLSETSTRHAAIPLRTRNERWAQEGGRPIAPTLAALIKTFPFVAYDMENDRLFIRPGDWQVTDDLVIPSTLPLHASSGTRLRFAPGKTFVSEAPLRFDGSAEAPIILSGLSSNQYWSGLAVLDAPNESHLKHVQIRQTTGIHRGGWILSGGTTFYQSPVTLSNCTFTASQAEDLLNVVGTHFTLKDSLLSHSRSDAFDGDYVTGDIRNCTFANTGSDAIDTSGSRITVSQCQFLQIGDKAFSIGESSQATLTNNLVRGAMIGLAAKDNSRVIVTGLTLDKIKNYTIAVYQKKPEYGPASVTATQVTGDSLDATPTLNQTGSTLSVNGVETASKTLDIDVLYQSKQLGQ